MFDGRTEQNVFWVIMSVLSCFPILIPHNCKSPLFFVQNRTRSVAQPPGLLRMSFAFSLLDVLWLAHGQPGVGLCRGEGGSSGAMAGWQWLCLGSPLCAGAGLGVTELPRACWGWWCAGRSPAWWPRSSPKHSSSAGCPGVQKEGFDCCCIQMYKRHPAFTDPQPAAVGEGLQQGITARRLHALVILLVLTLRDW